MLVLSGNNLFQETALDFNENSLQFEENDFEENDIDKISVLSFVVLSPQKRLAESENYRQRPKRTRMKRFREDDQLEHREVKLSCHSTAESAKNETNLVIPFEFYETIRFKEAVKDVNYYDAKIHGSIFAKDQETQLAFFRDHDVSEWFPLIADENGKVKFQIPKEYKNLAGLIYVIRNKIKQRYLIGETWQGLSSRMSNYASEINTPGSEIKVKKQGRIDFLTDAKENPQDFEVGILYKLTDSLEDDEDIKECEIQFIQGKSTVWHLYNDHQGGGGGVAQSLEEPICFAVPSTQPFTPEKYYPMRLNEKGKMRFNFSPGFKDRIKRIAEDIGSTQTFAYSIKNLDTGERYIGVTCDPQARAYKHAFLAEYADVNNEKYDPERLSGLLHFEIANDPENFAFGLFPLKSSENVLLDESIDEKALIHYSFPEGRGLLEKLLIAIKKSLHSENGFNANKGGGGGISNPRFKKRVKKKLNFLH